MRTKAIKDLVQLADPQMFEAISEGMTEILLSSSGLQGDAELLYTNKRHRSARAISIIAEEEAAKYLILLDAVRCPRTSGSPLPRQLGYFNSHMAKGIYAEYYGWRPGPFSEVKEWIDRERKQYYLDGPNDVDWIFHNDVLQRREDVLYVDYIENDGNHNWSSPMRYERMALSIFEPRSLAIAKVLHDAGLSDPAALATVAEIWRPMVMTDDYHWASLRKANYQTLERLDSHGLLKDQDNEIYGTIVNEWLFPIYSLDLSVIPVDQQGLRAIRGQWVP